MYISTDRNQLLMEVACISCLLICKKIKKLIILLLYNIFVLYKCNHLSYRPPRFEFRTSRLKVNEKN